MDAVTSLLGRGSPAWQSHGAAPLVSRAYNGTGDATEHFENSERHMLIAWIGLQLAGQIALPILIATLLFSKRIARRNPTIVNLCIVWTLATIPPELLFYIGREKGDQPSTMLCLIQASTISAVPPMAAMAYLSVVIHACTIINGIIRTQTPRPFAFDLRMVFLLGSPYICFFGFALMIAIIGAQNPGDVRRELFFCEVIHHRASIPVFIFAVAVVSLTLIAQGWIAVMFYRNFMSRRRTRRLTLGSRPALTNISAMDVQLLIRMVAFTVFEVVIVISSISAIFSPNMYGAQLLFATPPFAVFVIFSSSRDIYAAWFPCFFRRKDDLAPNTQGLVSEKSAPSQPQSPHAPSTISRYSQSSRGSDALMALPPVQVAEVWAQRERDVDLERGVVRPTSASGVVAFSDANAAGDGRDETWRGQGNSTVKVVDGLNLPSPGE